MIQENRNKIILDNLYNLCYNISIVKIKYIWSKKILDIYFNLCYNIRVVRIKGLNPLNVLKIILDR